MALSFGQIRSGIQEAVDDLYPPPTEHDWNWVVDVYDEGFAIVSMTYKGDAGLFRVEYEVEGDNDVVLNGEPKAVEERYVYKGTTELIASAVVAGEDAKQLLTDLTATNPLFAAIKDSPNTHLVVFDLTTAGKVSQHQGAVKYKLAKSGLTKALPTLISKPIHVTAGFDGHFVAGQAPKPIGAILGGVRIENADGTETLRVIGTLWSGDFPQEVEDIQASKDELGGSYEITYLAASATRVEPGVVEIAEYEFSGAAILKKTAAAHPETGVLVADDRALRAAPLGTEERNKLKDSDFALVETTDGRKTRRFPIQDEARRKNAWSRSHQEGVDLTDEQRKQVQDRTMNRAKREGDAWAKPYRKFNGKWFKTKQGGTNMKHPGIPDELDSAVDAIVAKALEASQKEGKVVEVTAELQETKTAMDQMEKEHKKVMDDKAAADAKVTAAEAKVTALAAQVAELTAKLAASTAEATTLKAEKAELEVAGKVEAAWKKLAADHGFTDKQKAEKLPILTKLAKGEPVTFEETQALIAGGKRGTVVPLMAGGNADEHRADPEALKKIWPGLNVRMR